MHARLTSVVGGWLVSMVLATSVPAQAAPKKPARTVIKVATVMPRGMPWTRAIARFAADVKRLTKGQVVFKVYYGGVAGSEVRTVAHMNSNRLQAVAAASVGLSKIVPSVRVLELPFLFRNTKEFRFVSRSMQAEFGRRFLKKGIRMLALTGIGWIYFFSKTAFTDVTHLKGRSIWTWKQDPVAAAMARLMSKVTLRLPLRGVLWALQSNTLDTVYGMPQAVLALQWSASVRYVLDLRINQSIAGLLIREATFKKLSPAHQKIVQARALVLQRRITLGSRTLNKKALKSMINAGLKRLQPSAAYRRKHNALRKKVWRGLVNLMYLRADLKKVKALLTLCRSTSCRIATSGRWPLMTATRRYCAAR